jgi:rubrerythrin
MLHSLIATHYAVIAEAENQHPTATLLRAIAKSEEVQYENCRRAIAALGGEEKPARADRKTATTISHNNLHAIIDYKIAYRSHLARYARHATQTENRYVARLLLWCDESDTRQIEFLRRQIATEHHPQHILIGRFYVCPTCSNLFDDEFHSHLCPLCMTSAERFFVFE